MPFERIPDIAIRMTWQSLISEFINPVSKSPVKQARKKPGPPRTTGPGVQVIVRLHQPMLGSIDEWRKNQEGAPSRPEAIRRLLGFAMIEMQVQANRNGAAKRKK
ncbi:MAG TPA: hypothetical protein VKP67_11700 [Xanthobacteraceae bacterium]|nr:hypothetical protein [Xanthobacteraceae bacterium]